MTGHLLCSIRGDVITKGDIFNLNSEVDEIERELEFLDPTHWYESRRIEVLNKRLDEIFTFLETDRSKPCGRLTLVPLSSGTNSSSVATNSPL